LFDLKTCHVRSEAVETSHVLLPASSQRPNGVDQFGAHS
jgi:hypothetical protein